MDTSKYCFQELFSTEDWALDMIPRPVLAVVVVYPMTVSILTKQINAIEALIKEGKHKNEDKLYFMKQFAENACGTIGLLHSVYNSQHKDPDLILKGSFLEKFYAETKDLDYDETGVQLKENKELQEEHKNVAQNSENNQSDVKQIADSHFAVYIEKNNKLFMMDGLTEFPIYLGPSSPETLLEDGIKDVKKMMDLEPGLINFSLMVLAKLDLGQ